jgi:hypothetical protein
MSWGSSLRSGAVRGDRAPHAQSYSPPSMSSNAVAVPGPSPLDPDLDKVRTDLEQCNIGAGGKVFGSTVMPEGKYSFKATGVETADAILTCMAGKGYVGKRTDFNQEYAYRRRTGGEGAPSR